MIDPNPKSFTELPAGSTGLQKEFAKAVDAALESDVLVAVFGTGYPIDAHANRFSRRFARRHPTAGQAQAAFCAAP